MIDRFLGHVVQMGRQNWRVRLYWPAQGLRLGNTPSVSWTNLCIFKYHQYCLALVGTEDENHEIENLFGKSAG